MMAVSRPQVSRLHDHVYSTKFLSSMINSCVTRCPNSMLDMCVQTTPIQTSSATMWSDLISLEKSNCQILHQAHITLFKYPHISIIITLFRTQLKLNRIRTINFHNYFGQILNFVIFIVVNKYIAYIYWLYRCHAC